MEEKNIKVDFYYRDDFLNESRTTEVCDNTGIEDSEFEFIVGKFKKFLLVCGFSQQLIDTLKIEEF